MKKKLREKVRRTAGDAALEETRPEWAPPMLVTLVHEPFDDDAWIYERKLDGVRLGALRIEGRVQLVSRSAEDRSATYFELREALEASSGPDLFADGEVVAFSRGKTSFRRLQQRMQIADESEARKRAQSVRVFYYLFDLTHLAGFDLTGVPLRSRKKLLRESVDFEDPLRFTPHRNGHGISYLEEACQKGWEGLIAKRAASEYIHGRSRNWLKLKCVRRQEFVIGGFTDPEGERKGFGALLIGYYEDDELIWAGKVGTGFDDELLESLGSELGRLERDTSPFDEGEPEDDGVHWVTPELVGEVAFTEWTDRGHLRHPRFIGLRRDKDGREVVRERARSAPEGVES